jgi:hypothetical protein
MRSHVNIFYSIILRLAADPHSKRSKESWDNFPQREAACPPMGQALPKWIVRATSSFSAKETV